jgi:hypothetical protein
MMWGGFGLVGWRGKAFLLTCVWRRFKEFAETKFDFAQF